jgi:predicted transcriptional regulator
MTVKDDLHELVDELDEQDAREVLAYLRALREFPSRPSPTFVDDTQRALDEALEDQGVRLPHRDVRAWLQTWGTPEQEAASKKLDALEERLRTEGRSATNP